MGRLKRIRVAGWKSIKAQTIELSPLTVVIGANGAGKSNLLSLVKLLGVLFSGTAGFRTYVGQAGYADSLLHYGSKKTPAAELELTFEAPTGEIRYFAHWTAAAAGMLVFAEERVEQQAADSIVPDVVDLGAGHSESHLAQFAEDGNPVARAAVDLIRGCRWFHFHDTSENSPIRQPSQVEANRFLYSDAGNLAAMLYLLRKKHPAAYRRIGATVRQMVPGFEDFSLEPSALNEKQILLNWTHQGQEYEFGPHQLSDGSLRFIALATLLLQPPEKLPLLIALDEPELGLHPAALEILAGIIQGASQNCQILISTQSTQFLDFFDPEDVVVVNSHTGCSEFARLSSAELGEWLEQYTLGEIWEKNIVGGGPYQ
ncbi:MAG: AAA family ATPase [Pirellulaceae bacterium]